MKINVEHEVPYDPGHRNQCLYDGDFWGNEMCHYLKYRDRTHGPKRPVERHLPKCTLFDEWLNGDEKCEACKRLCEAKAREEAE